jgi:hypothetical protein
MTNTGNTITVDGRVYTVENVHPIEEITPQLASHMQARGFNAYGYVSFPRGGNAIAYRAAQTGAWHLVQRVRS